MKLIGYHATVEHSRNILDSEGNLKLKKTNLGALPGDLGTGTYFFKDNPLLAKQFLEKMYPERPIKVIKCTIEVNDDFVLDFNDPDTFQAFLYFRHAHLEEAKKKFSKLRGKRNCIDGIIIDSMIRSILKEDNIKIQLVIKDTYTPTKEYSIDDKYLISNFFNGTELCVIDHTIATKGELYNGL